MGIYFKSGIFIGAYFDKKGLMTKVVNDIRKILENKIAGLQWVTDKEDKNGYHVTLIYSKNPPNKKVDLRGLPRALELFVSSKLMVLPYGEDYAVALNLDEGSGGVDNEIIEIHNQLKSEYGLNLVFDDYKPHVTIGVFSEEFLPFMRELVEDLSFEMPHDENRVFSYVTYLVDTAND